MFFSRWGVRNVIRPAQVDENTGSITSRPLSNIRLSLSEVGPLGLTTWQAEGRAKPYSPPSPWPAWVNRKDLVTSPLLRPHVWCLHPSVPLPLLTSPNPRPHVYFIRRAILHSNSRGDKAPVRLTAPGQECSRNSSVYSQLLCSLIRRLVEEFITFNLFTFCHKL